MDPEEITRLLGKNPTSAEYKGEIIKNQKTGRTRIARRGSWRLGVERRTPGNLDGQISEIFEGMNDDLAVWNDLASRYKADLFTGLFLREFNEGIDLSPQSLKQLGERGLLLDMDIYDGAEKLPYVGPFVSWVRARFL